jgi:hypothetical protein
MYDSNKISKALRSHDTAAILSALDDDRLKDSALAAKFMSAIKLSSSLVIQIESEEEEAKRDDLVDKCMALFEECSDASVLKEFLDHVDDAKLIEAIYREIFAAIHKSEAYQLSPAEQAWGTILRAEKELAILEERSQEELAKIMSKPGALFDPRQARVSAEDGTPVIRVDSREDLELLDLIAQNRLLHLFQPANGNKRTSIRGTDSRNPGRFGKGKEAKLQVRSRAGSYRCSRRVLPFTRRR